MSALLFPCLSQAVKARLAYYDNLGYLVPSQELLVELGLDMHTDCYIDNYGLMSCLCQMHIKTLFEIEKAIRRLLRKETLYYAKKG